LVGGNRQTRTTRRSSSQQGGRGAGQTVSRGVGWVMLEGGGQELYRNYTARFKEQPSGARLGGEAGMNVVIHRGSVRNSSWWIMRASSVGGGKRRNHFGGDKNQKKKESMTGVAKTAGSSGKSEHLNRGGRAKNESGARTPQSRQERLKRKKKTLYLANREIRTRLGPTEGPASDNDPPENFILRNNERARGAQGGITEMSKGTRHSTQKDQSYKWEV